MPIPTFLYNLVFCFSLSLKKQTNKRRGEEVVGERGKGGGVTFGEMNKNFPTIFLPFYIKNFYLGCVCVRNCVPDFFYLSNTTYQSNIIIIIFPLAFFYLFTFHANLI